MPFWKKVLSGLMLVLSGYEAGKALEKSENQVEVVVQVTELPKVSVEDNKEASILYVVGCIILLLIIFYKVQEYYKKYAKRVATKVYASAV